MTIASDTFTAHRGDGDGDDARTTDYLFLVIEGARPEAGGAAYCLDEVASVRIGRGGGRAATLVDRVLTIELPDRKLSSRHARLERGLTGWVLVDDGSKNGSFVGGRVVDRAELVDGDEIELGQSLLAYRDGLPVDAQRPIVDAADLAATPTGLASVRPDLAAALARVGVVAGSGAAILVQGETGTGKELLARAIHAASGRAGAFVAVNCGAIPPGLVESALFGHRRGAFTGADDDRPGYLREADGGTLLLDEVGDLPLPAQIALLRALEEREVVPVGETRPIAVDFRLVSATHRDLAQMVADGSFREDLYARLGGFRCALPALRERREDLGLIIARLPGAAPLSIEAARQLYRYPWPRNVRELAHCLTAAAALAGDAPIEPAHLPAEIAAGDAEDLPDADRGRRSELVKLLRAHQGNVSAVARELGKARMQVQRWLKRYALDPEHYRDG